VGAGVTSKEQERLRVLLGAFPTTRAPWRVGRTVGRTIYCGMADTDLIGMMDSRALAELAVLCHEYARAQLLGVHSGHD
jgi:hypothetical protein